ncbi:MAG: DUF5723 family protein [Rikenellaceae bacterium]
MAGKSGILKSIATVAVALTIIAQTSAQSYTSYFMHDAVERKDHNAAFAPDRGYFNIPIVGGFSVSSSGSLSLGQILYPDGSGYSVFVDPSISANSALSPLNDINTFGTDNTVTILGFGQYCKDRSSFWSFDLNVRSLVNFSAPYELFEFVKLAPDQIQISDVELYTDNYVEAAFGYSKVVNDKLTVGARVKFLGGLANGRFLIDEMTLTSEDGEWTSSNVVGGLDMYAPGLTVSNTPFGFEDIEIDDSAISGFSGYGAGIDLGATYNYSDRLQLSLAVNDLGFIAWNKDSNVRAMLSNNFIIYSIVYGDEVVYDTSESADLCYEDILFDKQSSQSSTKWLQANMNAGAEYALVEDMLNVGAIYSLDLWHTMTVHNFTPVVSFNPTDWFTLAASYTVASYGANAFGLALNVATNFVNLYLATDILTAKKDGELFVPLNQSMANVSFGLAIPMGKRGER